MATLPSLTTEQVADIVPDALHVLPIGRGGQKLVFRADLHGQTYALKFALVPEEIEAEEVPYAEVTARIHREVETMRDCSSPHMVKLGPIGLTFAEVSDQRVLYFSEEFIDGQDLRRLIRQHGPLAPAEVIQLGIHITDAIKGLWELGKIHRDIKPGNIMQRTGTGEFVLLDAGLAFDVVGESLSGGFLVGTPLYFSPEQFDYSSRRSGLDFRSDMFALGVTMYEALTGKHPFWNPGCSSETFCANIRTKTPPPPSQVIAGVPAGLDDVILRMIGKSPHLRFRKCDRLISALQEI